MKVIILRYLTIAIFLSIIVIVLKSSRRINEQNINQGSNFINNVRVNRITTISNPLVNTNKVAVQDTNSSNTTIRSADGFTPLKIPIVIFCSHRPEYMSRLLQSLYEIDGLDPDSTCLFACHESSVVTKKDIERTKEIIQQVKFCKARTIFAASSKRNAKEFKRQWYNTVQSVFESKDVLGFEKPYEGDILFLEDDIVLSKDAIKVISFMLKIKNSHPSVITVGLGGWSGENLVNPHPDTVAIRFMLFFPGMAYAFNASVWQQIKNSRFLTIKSNDWSEAIGWMWVGRYNVLVPTLGRMWHIGEKGLGHTGDGKKRRKIEPKPAWSKSPRLMDINKATLNEGLRDLFGMHCNQDHWRPFMSVKCLCPSTKRVFPNKRHFDVICVNQAGVTDKCIGRNE